MSLLQNIVSFIGLFCTRQLHRRFVGYGVATISRLHQITGLFADYRSLLQGSFAKETYNFKEPTIVATL